MITLGEKIREKRESLGYGLREFADKFNVNRSYLSELETNKLRSIPNDETLEKIADALNMTDKEKDDLLKLAKLERMPSDLKQELLTLREIVKKTEFVEKVIDGKIVQVGRITNKADSDKAEAIAKMLSDKTPEELEKIEQMMKLMFSK